MIRERVKENEEIIKLEEDKRNNQRKAILTQELVDYLGQEIEERSDMLTH